MRIRFVVATLLFVAAFSTWPLNAVSSQPPASPASASKAPDEEALGGLDPVHLVQGQEVDGKDALAVTYRGLVYYFATPETKAAFEREPGRYAVQLDGLCARMGPPVTGSPALYAVHDGRIYIFGSDECQKRFVADASRYIDTSSSPLAGLAPEAMTRGQQLLERAINAAGGAAALASVRAFHETTTQHFDGMRGPVTIALDTTAVLPDQWRQETANQFGRFLVVVTPGAAFTGSTRGEPRPLSDTLRDYYRGALGTHPLALLRAHQVKRLRAGALAPVTENGETLDRVAVERDGVASVLTLDQSGRIRSLTMRGHSPQDGVITDIVRTYSDYRSVGALTLPFKLETRIGGTVVPQLSYTVASLALNPQIDPASLTKPLEPKP